MKIDYSWWGWVDVSHDMMPRIVQPEPNRAMYYALGYGGNGVSYSAQAGRRMAAAARLLAELFGDLPVEGPVLQKETRAVAAVAEAQALAPHLQRLAAVVTRLSADPARLRAGLATRPFGPGARKDAAELWAAFDAAASASVVSEAAWDAVMPLAKLLDIPNRAGGGAAAASLFAGLVGRAEAAGCADLVPRLRAAARAYQASAALQLYARRTRKRWLPWWLAPLRRRQVLSAIGRALLVVDDPVQRRKLEAHRASLQRRRLRMVVAMSTVVIICGVIGGVHQLDADYATTAPYRHHAAISLAAPRLDGMVAPAEGDTIQARPRRGGTTMPATPHR